MKFSDLECCPFCGSEKFYTKQYAYGTIVCRERFDGEETDNEDLFESLNFKYSGRAYCLSCDRYLGNAKTNTVGKEATKAMRKGL